jgi:hypothetical protein
MTLDQEVGICAVCGTAHVEEEGFDGNRGCRNCGEWMVYSIIEYRDIVIDWVRLKQEFGDLIDSLNESYD